MKYFLLAILIGFYKGTANVEKRHGLWYNKLVLPAPCHCGFLGGSGEKKVVLPWWRLHRLVLKRGAGMRVLGIDPGYAICGYGLLDAVPGKVAPVSFGAVTTPAHTCFEDRLMEVYEDISQLLAHYTPDAMAIETLFFNSNQKTAVAVAEARGVILLAARQALVPIYEYSPLQVKQSICGYGKATKAQVQQMMRRHLCLKSIPKPDDAADALAIALCHANSARSLQFGRSKTRRQSMGYE